LKTLAVPFSEIATYHESSGTTGNPTESAFSEKDWDDVVSRFLRNSINICSTDTVLIKTPYSLVTTAHQMHRAAQKVGATIVPADNRSSNITYPKVIRLLKDLPITLSWSLPTELLFWARTAEKLGLNPKTDFPHIRAFFVAGEPLTEEKKEYLEFLWGGKKVYQDYGSTETGSLAGECSHGKLHLWSDRVFYEVLNETTKEAHPYGRGLLLVSTLHREAMPLVRYCLDDEVIISEEPCSCRNPLPTIQVLGRRASQLSVGDEPLYQNDLERIIYQLPFKYDIRFWRAKVTQHLIQIEIDTNHDFAEIAGDELAHEVYKKLKIPAEVTFNPNLIPEGVYAEKKEFNKPQYLFERDETWKNAVIY